MTKKRIIILAVVVLALVGAGGFLASQKGQSIAVAEAAKGELQTSVTGNGTLTDPASVEVFVPVAGKLAEVRVKDGQNVAAGDVLAELEKAPLELAVAQTEAQLAAAYAMPTNDDKLKTARWRAIQAAQAAKAEALSNLEKATLTAPKDGVVRLPSNAMAGQAVAPVDPVFIITGGELRFAAHIDETDIAAVKTGQMATVLLDAFKEPFTGKVTSVKPTAVTTSTGGVAYPVTVKIDPGKARLFVGMSGDATIITAKISDALIVPAQAVWTDKGERFVYRIDNNVATRTIVKIGAATDTQVEIANGLAAGDKVATSGIATLSDGARVHVP